ncbi:MAG: D-alanine--D-alanine ligase family protein [Anaerolineae bacterium]|nr:D-alanine--D-alanine ligase family protein [Anaerolineae bacterium]
MAVTRKTIVGVIFGGRSVEHDVSIVTGHQIMNAFDTTKYEVVPIYVTHDGKWFTGAPLCDIENFKDGEITSYDGVKSAILSPDVRHHGLIVNPLAGRFSKSEIRRLDVLFPAVHGTHGEDGTLQGLFELADIPYVGYATLGSALTNDKILTKQVLKQNDIPVLDSIFFTRSEWLNKPESILQRLKDGFGYPMFVKPATLGSSIGITRVDDESLLRPAIDIAANFDRRILVEPAVTDGIEINCAVMGYGDDIQTSVLEQPLSWSDFLAFEDKYLRGNEGMKSADRIIPAPLSDDLTRRIKDLSIQAFKAVDGRGIVRIDYLVKPDSNEVYLNELNTMPGSLSFYLWRETNLSDSAVVDKLVTLARDAYADKRRNMYDYKTNLVALAAGRGLKGAKGTKGVASHN